MFKNDFDPFRDALYYESQVIAANGKVFEGYEELKSKFMPLQDELQELGMVNAACHLDALPENFIKSGEDKMYLIDWEYSGNYDRLWDVASICVECELNEDQQE
jgi:thiamine kinase-like enzyme